MYLHLKEKYKVMYQILRVNLRTSIITLIGLSIALSTITTCFIYLETNRADYYLSLFEQDHFNSAVIYSHDPNDLQNFTTPADILSLQESLDQKISEYGLENVLQSNPSWYPTCSSITNWVHYSNQSESSPLLYGLNFNESILQDCVAGSYFPTNMNETILLVSSLSGLTIGDYYNISKLIGRTSGGIPEFYMHTLRITGLITPESLQNNSLLHETLNTYASSFSNYKIRILTNLEQFLNLISSINAKIDSPLYDISVSMRFRTNIQVSTFSTQNIVKLTSILVSFIDETKTFYLNGNYLSRLYSFNNTYWISNRNTYDSRSYLLFLLCIPAFLAAVLLIKFSLGLIHERRKKSMLLFRTRGVSSKFMFNGLFLELVVISLIATLISIPLGVLGYLLLSTTTGYLTFDLEKLSSTVLIPHLLFPLLIIFSVGFSFFTSFRPMIQLSKVKLAKLDQEATGKKNSHSRKNKRNINTFLVIQGLSGILILIVLLQLINGSNLEIESPKLLNLLLPVIMVLLVLSPLSFLVGFILTYNRFSPQLIKKIGDYCWKKDWGLLATVFRNLSVNYKITGQVTLLMACTLSFLMILSSLPVSLYQYNIDAVYYNEGADISITIPSGPNDTMILQELQTQLTSIQGVRFTTISQKGFSISGNGGVRKYIDFFGIEENFHQVAHWQKYYDDQSLQELVQMLFNSTESFPIILDSTTAQKENLLLNDRYQPFLTKLDSTVFTVEGVSDYWPRFIFPYIDATRHQLIVQRDLLKNMSIEINEEDLLSGIGYGVSADRLLCKVSPGYEIEVVLNQILTVTRNMEASLNVESVKSIIETNPENIFTQFLWLITNFNFLDSLLVVFIVIILFTFLRSSSRTTEIGLSRALGMKHYQIFFLMFFEPIALFILSGITGGIIGLLFLSLFASIMSPLLITAPPFILEFELLIICLVYLIIFMVTVIMGLITSFMATRANISTILKVE